MKNRKGFTLVELLVVVVVLGIITGLSIPLIRNIQERNRNREYLTYMDSLKYSAKLYVDSYGEDLFGRHKSGCTLIKYKDMVDKGLLKDIPVDKVSCNSAETFVKVVKMDDKYGYASSIGCGGLGADGKVKIDVKLPKTGLSSSDVCSVDAKTIMTFTADPSSKNSINYKKYNIKFKISSDTGINDNMVVYYGFSYNKDSNVINNDWKKLPVTIPGKQKQKEDIYEGKTISITTDDLRTPSVTGELYLVLQIETLENLTSDSWTTDPAQDKFLYFGPYTVDNTKPKFNDSTVISSETGFNSTKPKLKLKVTDEKYSTTNDLRMCISYDTDTCSTKVTDIRNNSKYEKYNANKVLPAIQNGYDSSNHTVYVTVADAAGNYEKANYPYRLARRYTLTYDSNGGNACNPTSKSLTFNDWESEPTWGELCKPTRTNYTFTGWNTKEDGKGTTVTSDTKATKNITVYAQWRENRVIFKLKLLDNASLTAQTKSDKGEVYNWTKDSNDYINLNGKVYSKAINYSASELDLANYNYSKYLNITRTGYRGEPSKEWICIDGCKTKNQTFNHDKISITPSTICDYSKADCTVVLKVNWKVIAYAITYTLDGGKVSGNPTSYNITTDTITLKNPEKDGYTFTGWTGSNGATAQTTVTIPKGSTGDKSYTANWSVNTYTITYTLDGGSVTGNPDTYTVETDTITLNNPGKEGYTFAGWTGSNGTKKEKTVTIPKGSTGNKTYKANWGVTDYSITYTLNGGTASGNPTSYNVTTDTITLNKPERDGYVFEGWTGSNGTKKEKTVTIPKGSTGDKSYTANWKIKDFSITYTLNGGEVSDNPSTYNAETETFTLKKPLRKGYVFEGWTGSNGTKKEKNVTIPKGSTGDKSYTANWRLVDYIIDYVLNGGSVSGNLNSYNITTNTFTLNNPTRSGYRFKGWTGYNGSTAQTTITIAKGSTGDREYVANWVKEDDLKKEFTPDKNEVCKPYKVPLSGTYRIELWGAQGGNSGGKGGYTKGDIYLLDGETYFFCVGGQGKKNANSGSAPVLVEGGINGGGTASGPQVNEPHHIPTRTWGSGGGSTDMRLVGGSWDSNASLYSRIMVAAGGGGRFTNTQPEPGYGEYAGGDGGGLTGGDGIDNPDSQYFGYWGTNGTGGTQTGPGYYIDNNHNTVYSYFGRAKNRCAACINSGGGGGYYAGGSSSHVQGAGGGSSFISGHSGCNAIKGANNRDPSGQPNHYSGKVFTNTSMRAGVNTGNGKAIITFLG